MLRTIALLVVGYAFYRFGREFIASVPSDFEPMPSAPTKPKSRTTAAKRSKSAKRSSAKVAPATTH